MEAPKATKEQHLAGITKHCNAPLDLNIRVAYDYPAHCLRVDFDKDFYVHKEILDSMNYYFQNFAAGKIIDDFIIFKVGEWLVDFLTLGNKIDLVKTDPFTGCVKIGKSY